MASRRAAASTSAYRLTTASRRPPTAAPDAHNPFVVGSVPESNVYVLRYDSSHAVVSELLDTANRTGSANEILRDVLGLDYTSPIWVAKKIREVLARYADSDLEESTARALRDELATLGLDAYFPETLATFLREKK